MFQWLSWTLPKYDGMILLKFQEKQGSFDGSFDVSRHQRNSQYVLKIAWSLSFVLNLAINFRPQDEWRTLKWWCTLGFDTWIGYNWNWRIWWRRGHEMNSVWDIFEMAFKYSDVLNIWISKGKYYLTTVARRAVVGRNKQLDKGAGRQPWKCFDLLNCVASIAFRKHGTWVQT